MIARDNDAEGERAALRLARRCACAGIPADTIVPDGGDFNDDIISLGAAALRARLGTFLHLRAAAGERA